MLNKLLFRNPFLLAAVLCLGLAAPLQAQPVTTSGYDGLLVRFQTGFSYSELLEDYSQEDGEYFGIGPYIAAQVGWAIASPLAVYVGAYAFLAPEAKGPELTALVNDDIGETAHDYFFSGLSFGFSWHHIPTAFYVSPELHFLQTGSRSAAQLISTGDNTFIRTNQKIDYASRFGVGLTIGKDVWLSEHFGLGMALFIHQDRLLLESSETTVTSDPSGEELDDNTADLRRVSARHLFYGLAVNITIN